MAALLHPVPASEQLDDPCLLEARLTRPPTPPAPAPELARAPPAAALASALPALDTVSATTPAPIPAPAPASALVPREKRNRHAPIRMCDYDTTTTPVSKFSNINVHLNINDLIVSFSGILRCPSSTSP